MTATIVEDFEVEDFEAEEHYPFAPPQQWVILSDQVSDSMLAVYTFTMSHLNPLTGKFEAGFGRRRVAERFGRDGVAKSLDWVDKQFRGLIEAGAMTRQHMYWIDAEDRTRTGPGRASEPRDPDSGVKRAQGPNRWRVRMAPPGGPVYPGPIRMAEYYDRALIQRRVTAAQRPGCEQREQVNQQVNGGPLQNGPRGAADERRGGAAAQRPKRPRKGLTTDEESGGVTRDPPRPPTERNPDQLAYGVTDQGELSGDVTTRASTPAREEPPPLPRQSPEDYPEPTPHDRALYGKALLRTCESCGAPPDRLCVRPNDTLPLPGIRAPHHKRGHWPSSGPPGPDAGRNRKPARKRPGRLAHESDMSDR